MPYCLAKAPLCLCWEKSPPCPLHRGEHPGQQSVRPNLGGCPTSTGQHVVRPSTWATVTAVPAHATRPGVLTGRVSPGAPLHLSEARGSKTHHVSVSIPQTPPQVRWDGALGSFSWNTNLRRRDPPSVTHHLPLDSLCLHSLTSTCFLGKEEKRFSLVRESLPFPFDELPVLFCAKKRNQQGFKGRPVQLSGSTYGRSMGRGRHEDARGAHWGSFVLETLNWQDSAPRA